MKMVKKIEPRKNIDLFILDTSNIYTCQCIKFD